MDIIKLKALLAISLSLVLFGCGGGSSGSDGSNSVGARTHQLLGKVYAKLIGDKVGQFKAEVKKLTSDLNSTEMSGTLD